MLIIELFEVWYIIQKQSTVNKVIVSVVNKVIVSVVNKVIVSVVNKVIVPVVYIGHIKALL